MLRTHHSAASDDHKPTAEDFRISGPAMETFATLPAGTAGPSTPLAALRSGRDDRISVLNCWPDF
jgi:hypothetical protein